VISSTPEQSKGAAENVNVGLTSSSVPRFANPLVAQQAAIETALREAAKRWKPWASQEQCPTCEGQSRETKGLVCQTCGHDYGEAEQS
jgi:hypothetical protein